jgi:hypothetical protein
MEVICFFVATIQVCCSIVVEFAIGTAFLIVTGLGRASCPDAAVWTAGFALGALTLAAAALTVFIGSSQRKGALATRGSRGSEGRGWVGCLITVSQLKHLVCWSATAQ